MKDIKNEILELLMNKNIVAVMDLRLYRKFNASKELIDNILEDLIKENKIKRFYKILCPSCEYPYFVFDSLNNIDHNNEYICYRCGEEIEGIDLMYSSYYTYYQGVK